jgi:hypothetical protein
LKIEDPPANASESRLKKIQAGGREFYVDENPNVEEAFRPVVE